MIYEITWGDSRGNSTRFQLPGGLEIELVEEIARAVKLWSAKRFAGSFAKQWVRAIKVEEQTVVTPLEFE